MIIVEGLRTNIGGVLIHNGINLNIETGETVSIIGRSGCGKTMLMRNIVGLQRVQEGKILLDNIDITKLSNDEFDKIRSNIGVAFQNGALFDSLNVYENVGFVLKRSKKYTDKEIRDIVEEKLELVGLKGIGNKKISELSGGMIKRVGIARAIATNPKYIFYDEPTTGLDPIMADVINDLIIHLKEKLKATSVVITHDMKSAYKVSQKIAMIHNGKIILHGTPQDFMNSTIKEVRNFVDGFMEEDLDADY